MRIGHRQSPARHGVSGHRPSRRHQFSGRRDDGRTL